MAKRAKGKKTRAKAPGGRRHGNAGQGAGAVAVSSLPDLPSLRDLPAWEDLTPSPEQSSELARVCQELAEAGDAALEELCMGCVVRLDRGFPAIVTQGSLVRAEFATRLTKSDYSKVAVGDWVCVRLPSGHQMAQVMAILTRTNDIARWRGGSRGEKQTLAANVGRVLVVQALGSDGVSLDRIARSALIAADCHASVAVVLTKADRLSVAELAKAVSSVRELLGAEAPVVVTSSMDSGRFDASQDSADFVTLDAMRQATESAGASWGYGHVAGLVPAGTVAIVLGESGAGKSTLLNALLGHEALETGAVRTKDDAGRHITVARRMVRLPQGGIIVDEPGLRSLPIVGHERGLALLFPEVAEEAQRCRFRDCTHTHEPGCAVREALETGACKPARVDAYVALAQEMRSSASSLDPDIVL